MTTDLRIEIAESLLEVVPRLGRLIAADIRRHAWPAAPAQFSVLISLLDGPSDLTGLAEELQVSLPTASRMVASLVERGWISRRRLDDDRRRVTVELTADGEASLEVLSATVRDYIRSSLEGLSAEECRVLLAGLSILAKLAGLAPPDDAQ